MPRRRRGRHGDGRTGRGDVGSGAAVLIPRCRRLHPSVRHHHPSSGRAQAGTGNPHRSQACGSTRAPATHAARTCRAGAIFHVPCYRPWQKRQPGSPTRGGTRDAAGHHRNRRLGRDNTIGGGRPDGGGAAGRRRRRPGTLPAPAAPAQRHTGLHTWLTECGAHAAGVARSISRYWSDSRLP